MIRPVGMIRSVDTPGIVPGQCLDSRGRLPVEFRALWIISVVGCLDFFLKPDCASLELLPAV
jgi:hypothetical protein